MHHTKVKSTENTKVRRMLYEVKIIILKQKDTLGREERSRSVSKEPQKLSRAKIKKGFHKY